MATTTFTLPGGPGVSITVTDIAGGDLEFTVAVGSDGGQTADLRGLFFHLMNFSSFTGLAVTGDPAVVTDCQFANNDVIDLGNGANMRGEASPFDIGVEFGTAGIGTGDDVKTVTFILSADQDLSLNDIELQQFGARLTSVGTEGGGRNDSLKLVGSAPEVNYPPDAIDDSAAVRADATKTIDVLANDTDADGDALSVASITGLDSLTEGSAQIVGNKVVFDPAPAFDTLLAGDIANVVFSYAAQDPDGLNDTADVTVKVVDVNEGTQTDTTNGTLANGQTASISLTTELRTIDDNTDISGTINIGNLATQKFNVVYIIDVSGSTSAQFGGSNVGDQNGDGSSNTVLDAEIAALRALTDEIVDRCFSDADVDIGLVSFSSGAVLNSTVFKPSQIADGQALDTALDALRFGGSTNFEAGLQQALNFFNGQADAATANNLAFFLSDGVPNSTTSYLNEATSLKTIVEVSAVGVGSGSSLSTLQPIDNTGGAQQVTTSDALRTALQDLMDPLIFTVVGIAVTTDDLL